MQLPDRAATVVVGNPLIADLSIQPGGLAVITGKGYGATNFIVLDRHGAVLTEKTIEVTGPSDKTVVVYRGTDRETYSCTPDCSRRITLGDFRITSTRLWRRQRTAMLRQRPPASPRDRALQTALNALRNRQRRRRLDLFHGEARGDVRQRHRRDQTFVEGVVTGHVRHHDAQHVIDVAGHPIKFHHFRHRADDLGEALQPFLRMVAGFDRDEDGDAKPDAVLIDQRDALLNDAVGFQPLDALPARRR